MTKIIDENIFIKKHQWYINSDLFLNIKNFKYKNKLLTILYSLDNKENIIDIINNKNFYCNNILFEKLKYKNWYSSKDIIYEYIYNDLYDKCVFYNKDFLNSEINNWLISDFEIFNIIDIINTLDKYIFSNINKISYKEMLYDIYGIEYYI